MRCYIFDIDGTLADLSHRLHYIQQTPKDYTAFYAACVDDKPIKHMCDLNHFLAHHEEIVLVSGRSDQVRSETVLWLGQYGVVWSGLYMRKVGDHRPDHLVKAELLYQLRADGFEPVMVFDDRDTVVAMWRARGIPCAQVAAGGF